MLEVLVYIVSTVVTYTMGIISKKLKWNEELPIPIQNIIIGIIVFVIFYLVKRPDDIELALQQLMLALGGVGTATLGYDTVKIRKEEDR